MYKINCKSNNSLKWIYYSHSMVAGGFEEMS